MLLAERHASSANGAFGRHEQHESDGIRLVTAASRWRSRTIAIMPNDRVSAARPSIRMNDAKGSSCCCCWRLLGHRVVLAAVPEEVKH